MWAHSPDSPGSGWHGLADHLRSTARWARCFAEGFCAGDLAYALGLFHDAGKAGRAWQAKLALVAGTSRPVGIDHKELGARLLAQTADVCAMAVLGHHGGLRDCTTIQDKVERAEQPDEPETTRRFLAEVPEAAKVLNGPFLIPEPWLAPGAELLLEMGIRMVFSALVDADHLDTGAYRRGLGGPQIAPSADWKVLLERFDRNRAEMIAGQAASPVAGVRAELYDAAVAAAQGKPGVYRMAAPTGSGKTLASGAFALHHAARHGKSRVIVAVPFMTVTEQNAAVYRSLLDDEDDPVVLEHHSSVSFEKSGKELTAEQADAGERWAKLAAENWDAPFVVTTTVQLFDSLFARKPSRMRKLHRLSNAVLVLDEVQALPKPLLLPILSALRTLVEHFGLTVLLTSATQPTFERLSVWDDLQIHEVVREPARMFAQTQRVDFRWWLDPKPSWADVVAAVAVEQQSLVVVNTVRDARTVFHMLHKATGQTPLHLSTRMCPRHRLEVLAKTTRRLKTGKPVTVVATPLVEAGVDVDFPVVFRALAPAESLLQAAGRANREGHLRRGRVVIFDPVEGGQPRDYRTATGSTRLHFGRAPLADPDNLEALQRYFEDLYLTLGLDNEAGADWSAAPRGQVIQRNRRHLDFLAVADGPEKDAGRSARRDRSLAFRMIDDDSISVAITSWKSSETVRQRLDDLRDPGRPQRDTLRQLQPWTVSLRADLASRADIVPLLSPVIGDLYEWRGAYDPDLGLDEESFGEGFVI
ncbi:CRISPR-associated helicase Cas3' [Crossiella sp. SN42]|uniref:CRISPR-associated helicase Cas3' n=1 Tax=Crossiella sp. SN42 TaxID=2944808 RepID=UPI00207C2551|nr:CRISPR-associated helicase Cas3' [Crossiella sp. SN42]MCO1575485.1 CRISPR-associated helicase Cas3' [Crossiella sp. SN42]